jgi:energy-coupling factor transporter transmembrane protein EcfT
MASPLSGVQFGPIVGLVLMLLAVVGMVVVVLRDPVYRAGIVVWLAATLAMLMLNPLPWQRYYVPLIPIVTLLASLGIAQVITLFVHRFEQDQPKRPIVTDEVQPQTIR